MRRQKVLMLCLAAVSLTPQPGLAGMKTYALPEGVSAFRPGPGRDVAESNCVACHSSDYISTQPPGLGTKFWETEVTRMKKLYGAQISEKDAAIIIDYLAQFY